MFQWLSFLQPMSFKGLNPTQSLVILWLPRSELHLIVSSRSTTPGETKLLASEIYELLQASTSTDSEPAEEAVSGRRKAQFFLGSSNKRAKTIILHIDGLDDSVSRMTV